MPSEPITRLGSPNQTPPHSGSFSCFQATVAPI